MLIALLVPVALAAGPHAVEHRDLAFDDPIAGRVAMRVYSPTDASAGPFPLALLMHGWLGQAWMYDRIGEDLASYGFVVTSLDTETGLVLDMRDYADDAVAALHEVEARSADPSSALAGLVSDADWTALGHSMGGGTLGLVLGLEPRVRTAVAFMPYQGLPEAYDAMAAFDGSLLLLSGSADTTAPPQMQQEWLAAADATSRSLLVEVEGMGHNSVTDLSWDEDPLPDDVQYEIVSALATAFVRAEHGGEEDLWAELVADPDGVAVQRWSRSHDPALWASLEGDRVSLGVSGDAPSTAEVMVGTGPAEEGLTDPVFVAALDLAQGVATASIDVPSDHEGDLWIAARTGDGAWTRAIRLATAPPVEPDFAPPAETPATTPAPTAAPSGCTTVPGAATVLGAWIGGLLARRRRG